MYKLYSNAVLTKEKPKAIFAPGFDIRQHVREMRQGSKLIYEFIGSGDFGAEWNTRRRYEVDAGRVEVPILYTPIYDVINDPSLPKIVPLLNVGPGGAVLEEVFEGGEVKFMSVTSSESSVTMRHFGVGLEYTKDLVIYNQLWNVPMMERAVGKAYNALQNHLHFNPILTASYSTPNQTGAVTSGATDEEDTLLTLQAGIVAARTDTTHPRSGPYALLISSANQFQIERALTRVPQVGTTKQSSAIDAITSVIAYDGWTGTRGRKVTTYTGVNSGKAYLIDLSHKSLDFQSYVKQGLDSAIGNSDVSRFILDQIVWDCYQGVYANPLAAVEEITLP
jgi:hypothetical protein